MFSHVLSIESRGGDDIMSHCDIQIFNYLIMLDSVCNVSQRIHWILIVQHSLWVMSDCNIAAWLSEL